MSTQGVEDQDLDFTRSKRRQIVTALCKDDKVPTDPEQLNLLLKTLDGIDKPALVKLRIKADEGISNNAAVAAAALAQVFMNPNSKRKPEVIELGVVDESKIPELPNDLPVPQVLPGELDVNPAQETYDSFMARQSQAA